MNNSNYILIYYRYYCKYKSEHKTIKSAIAEGLHMADCGEGFPVKVLNVKGELVHEFANELKGDNDK